MTDEELKAIEDLWDELRIASGYATESGQDRVSVKTKVFAEVTACGSNLLAEVRRLRANPDCPACGHSVTGHEVTVEPYESHFPERWVGCSVQDCECHNWSVTT